VLLSEATARVLGISDQPIGQQITLDGEQMHVIGMVQDVHNWSLHQQTRPVVLTLDPGAHVMALVRLDANQVARGLGVLEETWRRFVPDRPFTFRFLDDRIQQQYQGEQRLGRILFLFAVLAIVIACLGLLGLTAFMVQRRSKEIGIRKTLGATVGGIVVLLTRDYAWLVVIGFAAAAPLAYAVLHAWLSRFAYRVDLDARYFLIAGVLTLMLAVMTVSVQAIRAALADPVESLRYE